MQDDNYGEQSEIRPLPALPVAGESGWKTTSLGAAYGYGDWPPYSGPRNCPVYNGSGIIEGGNQPN